MICNHCGKEVESLKSAIIQLHSEGKTAAEIRDDLVTSGRLAGSKSKMLRTVYNYLRTYELSPHLK